MLMRSSIFSSAAFYARGPELMATFMDRCERTANRFDATLHIRRHRRKLVVNPQLIENVELGRDVLAGTSSSVCADR